MLGGGKTCRNFGFGLITDEFTRGGINVFKYNKNDFGVVFP